jgi:hypothetical protein
MFTITRDMEINMQTFITTALTEGEESQLLTSAALILEEFAPGTRKIEYRMGPWPRKWHWPWNSLGAFGSKRKYQRS